jgi:O-antigen ligase
MFSIVNLEDASVRNRIEMLDRGLAMTADFPLSGTGIQQVGKLYPRYKSEKSFPDVPHLHNNVLQVAVERGLPAAVVWLWFIASLGLGSARLARAPGTSRWSRIAAFASFGAVVGVFTAGMFEYNFGDTEVLILFLLLATLPFGIREEGVSRE